MADPRKVRWSQLKVGVLGLGAFSILSVLIFLLTSSKGFFQKTALLYTYMADASGMAEGTPVRLNGFTIGTLDTIELTKSTDPKRAVEFIMKVQEKFLPQIPVDSVAGISAANLLGDKFINIGKLLKDEELYDRLNGIASEGQSLLADVRKGQGTISKLIYDDALYQEIR